MVYLQGGSVTKLISFYCLRLGMKQGQKLEAGTRGQETVKVKIIRENKNPWEQEVLAGRTDRTPAGFENHAYP